MKYQSKLTYVISHIVLIFIFLVIIFCLAIISAVVAGEIYGMQHDIPNDLERIDVDGYSGEFVIIKFFMLSIIPSTIVSICFYRRFFKRIFKFIEGKK